MTNQQIDGRGRPAASCDLYRSLVLEIEAALASGAACELTAASLAALTQQDLVRLRESRRCLELLYHAAGKKHRRDRAAHTTLLLEPPDPSAPSNEPEESGGARDVSSPREFQQEAGSMRLGRFEIVREIGRGGQGVVFLARDPRLKRLIALKVPRPEIVMSQARRRRFMTEGHAAAILTHPNVVTALEAGQIGPVCYLAQAYIDGPTLGEWRRRQSAPISPRAAALIVAQLADGVEYAHARGVLHRDLKPSNVLLDSEFSAGGDLPFVPRITDFGVARVLEFQEQETVTGTVLGTALYMSPEQAAGHNRQTTAASDIYSLGAILYELLTGAPVFEGETYLETLRLVATAEPVSPRKARGDISRDLEAICLTCLEKDPRRRYASAFELAADLRRLLAGEPTRVRPIKPAERLVRWCRRKPALAGLIGVTVAALMALIANILWTQNRLSHLIVEANAGRQRAEENEKLANDNRELALRREIAAETMAYVADMRLVAESWENSSAPAIESLLEAHRPPRGRPDLRGFEWWLYHNRLKHDTPSKQLCDHQGKVESVAVSPRGDRAASGGADGVIRLWNLSSGALARELRGHDRGEINSLAFSPDGSRLASASNDKTVRVWDIDKGAALKCLVGHTAWVGAVIFLSDRDTLVSGAADKTIRVWDLKSGTVRQRLLGHTGAVRTLAFQRPTRLLYSAAEDGTVRVWDTGSLRASPLVPDGLLENPGRYWIRCLAIEPDQTTMLGVPFADQPVVVWDLRPDHFGVIHKMLTVAGNARSAAIAGSVDHPAVAFGLEDSYVRVRQYGSMDDARVLRGHQQTVNAVALTPDGTGLVSGSQDGTVRLWDLRLAERSIQQLALASPIFSTAISPDGQRVAASMTDGETKLLSFESLKTYCKIGNRGAAPAVVAFSPDSTHLAVIAAGEPLRLYSSTPARSDGAPSRQIGVSGTTRISGICFSSDGRLVAVANQSTVIVVDIERGVVRDRLLHKTPVRDLTFIDAANLLTSSVAGDLCRWSFYRELECKQVPLHCGELHEIAVSPDRRMAAVRGFRQVKVVDAATLRVVTSLPDNGESGGICFLGGGRTLFLGEQLGRACLWHTGVWQRMGLPESELLFAARASSDGYRIIGTRGTVLTRIDARPSLDSQSVSRQ